MKIRDLLKREPFYTLCAETLQSYIQKRFQKNSVVSLTPLPKRAEATVFYVNELLNMIITPQTTRVALEPIRNEFLYSCRGGLLRRWMQWLYVSCATQPRLARLFSHQRLYVTAAECLGTDSVIVGGRQKLRLLDHRAQTCTVMVKSGYDRSVCDKDIQIRRAYPQLPVPELIEEGEWGYIERYVSGTPLNRMERVAEEHMHQLLVLLESCDRQRVDMLSYLSNLKEDLIRIILESELLLDYKSLVLDAFGRLFSYVKGQGVDDIETCLSHGDFQEGNILFDGQTYWIIDWENAGHRSIWYDRYTLAFNLRFPTLLSGELQRFFLSDSVAACVVLMENIVLLARQNANPFYENVDDEWIGFFDTLPSVIQELKS